MPKSGFKSLTIRENVYDHFHVEYKKQQKQLALKGITSFAGYMTLQLAKQMEKKA